MFSLIVSGLALVAAGITKIYLSKKIEDDISQMLAAKKQKKNEEEKQQEQT